MFWNSQDLHEGFRIVSDKVVFISSIHSDFGVHLMQKQRNEVKIFNTFAKPNWYLVHKWYKDTPNKE